MFDSVSVEEAREPGSGNSMSVCQASPQEIYRSGRHMRLFPFPTVMCLVGIKTKAYLLYSAGKAPACWILCKDEQ